MAGRVGVATRDLRRLCAVTDPASLQGADGGMSAMLASLRQLIPCDQISYQAINPNAREYDGMDVDPTVDDVVDDDFFWDTFWTSPVCSYPHVAGDRRAVRRATDFHSTSELTRLQVGELLRLQGMRYSALIPLNWDGASGYRLELFRSDGPDFSDREVLLMSLLRPSLAEAERDRRARLADPQLTPRQRELLGLVGEGLTNRQIARQLKLSEATVRRHLENIFVRLGVHSRTAALRRAQSTSAT